jgi:heat shock protein HslJ
MLLPRLHEHPRIETTDRATGLQEREVMPNRKKAVFAGFMLVLTAGWAGCGSNDSDGERDRPAAVPTGQVWVLHSVTPHTALQNSWGDSPIQMEQPDLYTIEFDVEGNYMFRADCNRGRGSYSFGQGTLGLRGGPVTLAECGPDSYSNQYLESLGMVSSFSLPGDTLVFHFGDEWKMGFVPLETSPSLGGTASLPGTEWTVIGVNNGRGGVTSALATTDLTVRFGADGTVSGSAGCNDFTGSFATDDADGIEFGPLAATLKACIDEEVVEQELHLLRALENSTRWEIRGERLQLRDDDGSLQVDLKRY